ncbi:MAG: DinB family protein [Acidobacteriaceae bacterium]
MSIAEKLLPEFDREFASARKFLALVPDDKLGWKPHVKSMELGRLAWHVSDFPGFALNILTKPGLSFNMEDMPKRRSAWVGKTREAILERLDTDLKSAREALLATPDAAWDDPWKLEFGGQVVVDDARSLVYRMVAMSHMIHHRAQLGLYLRMNEIPIPGVYGPSADEM